MTGTMNVDSGISLSWKIPDFSTLCEECVESSKTSFTALDGSVHELWLSCWPRSSNDYVGMYLNCSSRVTVSFNISILDKDGENHITRTTPKRTFPPNVWGWPTIIKREELLSNPDVLSDGVLSVRCIITQGDINSLRTMIRPSKQMLSELSMDFKTLRLSGDHHDVSIVVGDNVYPAHKSILSARSSVFKAMLSHEMLESKENKIVISDIKENVVVELLEYIYSGESPNLNEMAEDLLAAADKYGLEGLKERCALCLSKTITADNACKRYMLSYLINNLDNLARDVEKFASKNMPAIMKTPAFDELSRNPDVLKKLLHSLFKE